MALSERQQNILQFLRSFTVENGYPPTIREIGQAVGISSTSVVNYNLNVLQREGHLFRDRTVSRGLRLTESLMEFADSARLISVPLLGHIAAGEPIDVPEGAYSDESIELTRDLVPSEDNIYALKVKGTSMIDAFINDGDIVVMKHATTANNGDMVAAWIKDREETTLKRFFNEGRRVRLQPENATMDPIFLDPANVDIQGKVIAVVRQLG
jgi:repressor LexA